MRLPEVGSKTEVLYGIHPVLEAFRAGRRSFHELYLVQDRHLKSAAPIIRRAESLNLPITRIPPARMTAVTGARTHQGVALRAGPYPLTPWPETVLALKAAAEKPFVLLLDGVTDPQNLGALIRTAYCAGIQGVVLPRDRSAGPTPAVAKASSGALEHVRLCCVSNLVHSLKALKDQGVWIAGMDRDAPGCIYEMDFTGGIGLVLGGEEKGIRPLVKQHCDFLISIPQAGRLNSLNASAAGAVALYEVYRQRNRKDIGNDGRGKNFY